jgi:hypothetical protein
MRAGAGLPAASRTMVGDMNPARSGRARGLTRHCVCMECFFRRHRGGGPGVRERGSGMRAREEAACAYGRAFHTAQTFGVL